MPLILQINECLNYSTGKIAQQIGELAIKKGWESWIVYSGREKTFSSKSKLIKVGSIVDSIIHYSNQRLFDKEGLLSARATKGLVHEIEIIKPDIIHLHNIHDHWLNYEVLFEYIANERIPIVWTQHDCWSFTGGCMYYDMLNCYNWKCGCKSCPDKRSLFNNSEKNLAQKIGLLSKLDNITFVPVSDWLNGALRESALSKHKIITIHNGIDVNVFKPYDRKTGIKDKIVLLGVAAVWSKRKGLDDFIKLHSFLPKEKYSIYLVGLNKKQLQNLPDGIYGIERTQSAQELAKLYSEADLFLNLTYSDNFPTTNIEALACGTPVITYKTGGSPEAIDEKTGVVVNQGDMDSLKQAILKLQKNPLKREDCRKRAETLFNKDVCFEEYFKIYNELLHE